MLASASVADVKRHIETNLKIAGTTLSKKFKKIMTDKPMLEVGKPKEWINIDSIRFKNLKINEITYQQSCCLYNEVEMLIVMMSMYSERQAEGYKQWVQYHLESMVTNSSLGYYEAEITRLREPSDKIDRLLNLDPQRFPPRRNPNGSMRTLQKKMRSHKDRKSLQEEDLMNHQAIVGKILTII